RAGRKDREGVVRIPGFYDDVEPPPDEERAGWRSLPVDEDDLRAMMGVTALAGEEGYSAHERRGARPTLDVHGVMGGFTGPGLKTVIPARATANVCMRLVPRQDTEE